MCVCVCVSVCVCVCVLTRSSFHGSNWFRPISYSLGGSHLHSEPAVIESSNSSDNNIIIGPRSFPPEGSVGEEEKEEEKGVRMER